MKNRILTYLFFIIVCTALYFYFTKELWMNKFAENLTVSDPLKKSEIAICIGGWFDRDSIKYCVDLMNKGYAREVLFLGDKIRFAGERDTWASLGKKFAEKLGCPGEKIIINEKPSSTYEEAVISKMIMDKREYTRAIVVTSPFHGYRTKKVFQKVFNGSKYRLIFTYPRTDPLLVDSWWIDEASTVILFNEYVKIVWYKIKYGI